MITDGVSTVPEYRMIFLRATHSGFETHRLLSAVRPGSHHLQPAGIATAAAVNTRSHDDQAGSAYPRRHENAPRHGPTPPVSQLAETGNRMPA
jgi:hypothetical protein